jgi:hypothetical protein
MRDTGGEYFQMATSLPPGGFVVARHVHPYRRERFEVLEGTARFRIGDIERDAPAGETVTAPLGSGTRSGIRARSRFVSCPSSGPTTIFRREGECGGPFTATATATSRTRRSRYVGL